jgi:3-oxoacyl-(acyl-carrier-protein) synthase
MQERERALAESGPVCALEENILAEKLNAYFPGISQVHVNTACTSGAMALGLAAEKARLDGEEMLVVAYEQISRFNTAGFRALHLLTEHTRPFSRERQGFALGEAVAVARVMPVAEDVCLTGFGASADAHHPTGPHRQGKGLAQAIRESLAQAGIGPEQVSCIKLNGVATVYSDAAEISALESVFGGLLPDMPVFFFKHRLGHMQGAAGLVESFLAVDCVRNRLVPAVSPDMHIDAAFSLNLSGVPRDMDIRHCLALFSGLGGFNAALVFSLFRERPAAGRAS